MPASFAGVLPGASGLIHQVTVAPRGTYADFTTDGTDDHVEIEAAIAALPAGGGAVCIRGGNYTLGRAVRANKANVRLWGEGAATILKLANSADDNVITCTAAKVVVEKLKCDGNRTNIDFDHHGVSFERGSDDCTLRDAWITETVHHGTQSSNATNLVIDNVLATNTGKVGSNRDGVGIVVGGGQGPCVGARVSNCRVFNTGYHGYQVYRGSQHVTMVNCHAAQTGQTRDTGNSLEVHPGTLDVHVSQFVGIGSASGANGAGIVVDSESGTAPAKAVTLHSCMIDGHALSGIVVNGASEVTIVAGQVRNNGRVGAGSNTYGIRVKNGSAGDVPNHVHILGTQIYDDQVSKTQTHPVAVFDGSTGVLVTGNTFFGHATSDSVLIDGTSTGVVSRFMNTGDTGDLVSTFKSRSHRKVHADVVSLYADWMNLSSNQVATAANDLYGYVMRVPRSGKLRDIMVQFNAPSGNVAVSVYDVGSGGTTRNRLYASGSIATTGMAQGWNIVADPNIDVVEGQLVCLCVAIDNVTATMGRYNAMVGSASAEIPAAFAPEGNVRMCCRKTSSFPDAGTTWTTPGLTTVPFGIVARVS